MPCASSDVLLSKSWSHSIALKGRMVTNTLGEIRKRADLCDSKGAMLKVDIETEATEGEMMSPCLPLMLRPHLLCNTS
jgi:hypothetical protein